MYRIGAAFLAVLILAPSHPKLAADDLHNAREVRWLKMLREQIPQVSESQQRTAIAMTVAVLAETGNVTEAKTIALQQK